MNETLARALLRPIDAEDSLALAVIEVHRSAEDPRGDVLHVVLSPSLRLLVSARSDGRVAFRTRDFDVTIDNTGGPLSRSEQAAIDALRRRLEAVETPDSPPWHERDASEGAVLWLIPGHIGNPLDVGVRALRVLRGVERVFAETGKGPAIERLYAQYGLGPPPELVTLDASDDALRTALTEGMQRGRTMALFGADEGLPGLCDPGWRVMALVSELGPAPRVRSISAGSALSTALLHRDRRGTHVSFLGLLDNVDGTSHLWPYLARQRRSPLRPLPPAYCFAHGQEVHAAWPRLVRATRRLRGRLTLLQNLAQPDERVDRFALCALSEVDLAFLGGEDKVVLQLDFDPPPWLDRLLRRVGRDGGEAG